MKHDLSCGVFDPMPEPCSCSISRRRIARLTETEKLHAVAAEYNDLIRYMDAGGDYHEFMASKIHGATA